MLRSRWPISTSTWHRCGQPSISTTRWTCSIGYVQRRIMDDEVVVEINADADLVAARAEARALAIRLGFSRTDATLIATAISEITRNIVVHVGKGELVMRAVYEDHRYGLVVVASDEGPGIRDVEAALAEGNAARGG